MSLNSNCRELVAAFFCLQLHKSTHLNTTIINHCSTYHNVAWLMVTNQLTTALILTLKETHQIHKTPEVFMIVKIYT